MTTTYQVRIWRITVYRGKRVTTYTVRWKVGTDEWKAHYQTSAQADSFRSELVAAQRRGEAFSLSTGRPVSWQRAQQDMSWYEFACAYADMKWKRASAKIGRAHV